jgi:hypothetical protein
MWLASRLYNCVSNGYIILKVHEFYQISENVLGKYALFKVQILFLFLVTFYLQYRGLAAYGYISVKSKPSWSVGVRHIEYES